MTSTVRDRIERRFKEAFGEGNPREWRPLPGVPGYRVRLRGTAVLVTKAPDGDTIPVPSAEDGVGET